MEYVSALSEGFQYNRAVVLCAKSVDYKFYEHMNIKQLQSLKYLQCIIYNFITHIYLLF